MRDCRNIYVAFPPRATERSTGKEWIGKEDD